MNSKRTGREPSDLSPEVEDLLAHERVPPAQPEALRARLLSRAREAVLHGPPAPVSLRAPRLGATRAIVTAAAGIVAVAGVAGLVLWRSSEPSAPPAGVTVSAAAPVAPPPVAPAPAPEPEAALGAASASRATEEAPGTSSRPAPSSRSDGGAEELQLLSRARQADARRDYASVLAILSEHERSFPRGRLSEEREVLRVRALVGLGRGDQARRVGQKFRRNFPRSVLIHKVDEMLASLP